MWGVEKFLQPFKDGGWSVTYVTNKDAYLDARRTQGPNDIIVFSDGSIDHVVFLSDTGADTFTFTLMGYIVRRRDG